MRLINYNGTPEDFDYTYFNLTSEFNVHIPINNSNNTSFILQRTSKKIELEKCNSSYFSIKGINISEFICIKKIKILIYLEDMEMVLKVIIF